MTEDRHAPVSFPHPAPDARSSTRSPVPPPTPTTPRAPLVPVPRRVIATAAALIAAATIGLVVVLWWAGTAGLSGAALVTARFDALRTGLSIGIGGGGVFALYLAWRRQHATEIGLVQKERDQADVARAYELQRETAEHTRQHAEHVAATTERDAEARRITDLYAKSVEQLGSDKAPVRHGGLYALERLAQDHPALRQTVVNVLCAYLRAPFDPCGDPPDADTDRAVRDEHRERVQEREVRLTAQRILTTHLEPGNDADHPVATFWPGTDLDLTAAVLVDWDATGCLLRGATFRRTTFTGDTRFDGATFTGEALFDEAVFTRSAPFSRTRFARVTYFTGATFTEEARFKEAEFATAVWFQGSTFTGSACFDGATFTGNAMFGGATFGRSALFRRAEFIGDALFPKARFTGNALLGEVRFTGTGFFGRTTFAGDALFGKATFGKSALFSRAEFIGDARFGKVTFTGDAWFSEAAFTGNTRFENSTFRHSSSDRTSWPDRWRPSPDHTTIGGREGTWHHLLEVEPGCGHPDEPALGAAGHLSREPVPNTSSTSARRPHRCTAP
ncbi:pentapeptide repeat-containing protein [Saccharothrix lopnurensis]|uniref:Pentapeptide repeat-containing protein n=1 Tax=Saccharothrix lopnurensis TaxID=1670621 RepID=A0ABW1P1H3_9PSEU